MESEIQNKSQEKLKLSEYLQTFSPEVQKQYDELPRGLKDDGLLILAEGKIHQGDLHIAENIIGIIEDTDYIQKKGLISLSLAEYKQGNKEKADERVANILEQVKKDDHDYLYPNISQYYFQTDRVEKVLEIIDDIKVENDPNLAWSIIEPLASYELNDGRYQEAIALEKYLSIEYYSTELLVMVARKIGHQFPEEAVKILQRASESATNEKNGTSSHKVDNAWAFIGQPENIKHGKLPSQTLELAKHNFITGNISTGKDLIEKAIVETIKSHTNDSTDLASLYCECGRAYLLLSDPEHKKTKEYLYKAIQTISGIKYEGLYQEEMAYEKDGLLQKIEQTLMEIGDLDGIKKAHSVAISSGKYRAQLEILALQVKSET